MARVVWSKIADDDLKSIASFIQKDSLYYAKQIVQLIHAKVTKLKDFPFTGRVIPEFNQDQFREIITGNYRIMYFVELDTVTVITIVHSRRDI